MGGTSTPQLTTTRSLLCRLRLQMCKMAASSSRIFRLHFCTASGSGDASSIFICSVWFVQAHPMLTLQVCLALVIAVREHFSDIDKRADQSNMILPRPYSPEKLIWAAKWPVLTVVMHVFKILNINIKVYFDLFDINLPEVKNVRRGHFISCIRTSESKKIWNYATVTGEWFSNLSINILSKALRRPLKFLWHSDGWLAV